MADQDPAFYAIYKTATGRVVRGGVNTVWGIANWPAGGLGVGEAILQVSRRPQLGPGYGEWIVSGSMVAGAAWSPTLSTTTIDADGVTEAIFSSLPNPTWISISHSDPLVTPQTEILITDGSAVITATRTGTIYVALHSPGKIHVVRTIDAV